MKKLLLFLSVILLSSLKAMAAEPYALLSNNNTKLTFYYGTKPTNGMSVGPFTAASSRGWHNAAATITTVEFNTSMANCNTITSTAYWFFDLENLTTITGIDNLKTANVTTMLNMFYYCSSLTSLILSGFDTGSVKNMDGMFYNCSSLTTLDVRKFNTGNVKDMSSMFFGCKSLTGLDVSRFDTGEVTDMAYMFDGCLSLTSLNVSGFDTGKVTKMTYMFCNCRKLTTLDVSKFKTGSVKNMYGMFQNCDNLTSLDVSGFDTGEVTDMGQMFYSCSSLTSLDVSGFNTGSVTNMEEMFFNCSSLKIIYCYDTWTPNTSSHWMFLGCTSLVGGTGTTYNYQNVNAAYAHPNDGGYFSKKPYALLSNNNTKLTFYYGTKPAEGMDVGPFTSFRKRGWHSAAATITTVEFHASMANCKNITSTAYWFDELEALTTVTGIGNLKTSNVTDMSNMFYSCKSLTSLVVSGFDTGNVTDMKNMFYGCCNLTSLDVSGFKTSNVKNMSFMFYNCKKLTSLDVSNFDASKAESLGAMFTSCEKLTSLDISNFNISEVTRTNDTFKNCYNLQTIYCYDTWNPENGARLFEGCENLIGGDGTHYSSNNTDATYAHPNAGGYFSKKPYALLSNNNTKLTFYYGTKPAEGMDVRPFTAASGRGWHSAATTITTVEFHASMAICKNITSTACWFENLENLTTITGIDNLNTANVTNMSYMFDNCTGLTSVDVSGFDTGNVTDMIRMFSYCRNLKTIYCNDTWNPNTSSQRMFLGCNSLVGGTGTPYNYENVNAAYAHPNEGGYFTRKGLKGDVNSDGKVTPADAIMILYRYFGVDQTGFNESVADVNGDENISPADAIEALYIYFGSSGGNARTTQPMTDSSLNPE